MAVFCPLVTWSGKPSAGACGLLGGMRSWWEDGGLGEFDNEFEPSPELLLPVSCPCRVACASHCTPCRSIPPVSSRWWSHSGLQITTFPWILVCMRPSMLPPQVEFLYPSPGNSCIKPCWPSKPDALSGFSKCQTPRLGVWCGAQNFYSCWRASVI